MKLHLPDTVQLATTTNDGYGDKTVIVLTDTRSLFVQRTSDQHGSSSDGIISDAVVYLDPTNAVVVDNAYRLEGMYIIADPFGEDQHKSWYRITHVSVAQRKLLTNAIDNIFCHLEKESGVPYVTYVS